MMLCGNSICAGEKKSVFLPIPGAAPLRAVLYCGARPGKTLAVTAGVHGCEYVGIEAARRLERLLDPAALSGNVILLPLINKVGFYAGIKQIMPVDGKNLNRAFPGSSDGTVTERLAHLLETTLYPDIDFLLDLHGGDWNEAMCPLVFFPAAGTSQVNAVSLAAAKTLHVSYRVPSTAKNGLYSWAIQQRVPALLVERGGQGRWSEDEVSACLADVQALMEYLNILPEPPAELPQQEIAEAVYEESPADGFWYPQTTAGAAIRRGELLGKLNTDAASLEVRAKFDGVTLYYTTALGVRAGDPLIAYGRT
ncbi:M14 family metallopeptidase [Oscillibacter sp. GMB15532]|uniref:M14 family metallopeptidase n=1 Tax=Oscillibacter sp. GMB15532 TaxID=3230022 RepID=UPI0034E05474